jgi:hypothetical protein
MELETQLQKERQKLGELRKRNYKADENGEGNSGRNTPLKVGV